MAVVIVKKPSRLSVGTPVQLIAPRASRFICQQGDTGVVSKVARSTVCPRTQKKDDDLYFVTLDSPRTKQAVAYLTASEIRAIR